MDVAAPQHSGNASSEAFTVVECAVNVLEQRK